jgi:hypothetical protein
MGPTPPNVNLRERNTSRALKGLPSAEIRKTVTNSIGAGHHQQQDYGRPRHRVKTKYDTGDARGGGLFW